MPPGTAKVFVITGPSGVGKGTLIGQLLKRRPELQLSISATTRDPRPGEADGVEYHFLAPEEFDRRVAAGEFLEHAAYSGNQYGTLRSEVDRRIESGHPVVLEIEIQGAEQIRETMPEAIQVFVAPPEPEFESLKARLVGRGTDSAEAIEGRLAVARHELAAQEHFHHQVVNDSLEHATNQLEAIVAPDLSESSQ
ncbi:MAG: guanylate kinase [Solirubrobacterales bacterium]|nr:guanylate kinase [Solirubrobacterales bacterium]